jgi:AcrR family transcriptional regulator
VKKDSEIALIEAAEAVLERDGFTAISVRSIAREAEVQPGLIHYYFESLDGLLARVVERCADWLLDSQGAAFSADRTLAHQWHHATEPLRTNHGRRRMKVWFEISVMAVNRPELLRRVVAVNAEWRRIIYDALERERVASDSAAGIALPIGVMTSLVSVILKGLYWENLQEFHDGHLELLDTADQILTSLATMETPQSPTR